MNQEALMRPDHPTDRNPHHPGRPRRRKWNMPLAALAGLLIAGPAAAEPFGYSVSYGDLLWLDLSSGEAEVFGPIGTGHSVRALTFGPEETLYGLGVNAGESALLRFDAATGAAEVVAAIPPDIDVGALAATGDGDLWVAVGTDLYRLDPTTGALAPPVLLQERLRALASRGGELYGFTLGNELQRIDPASGAFEPILTIDEPLGELVLDAHFDGRGALWFLTATGGGIPEQVYRAVYRVADLDAGVIEQTFGRTYYFTDFRAEMESLALPPPTTVDVPTLGGAALGWLALLIAGTGLAVLGRRRR